MPRVVHFEICADQPERAVEFYQNVFGWEVRRWDGPLEYWLIITGDDDEPGINGGLVHRDSSVVGPTNIIDVDSLDVAMLRVAQSGGDIIQSSSPTAWTLKATISPCWRGTSRRPDRIPGPAPAYKCPPNRSFRLSCSVFCRHCSDIWIRRKTSIIRPDSCFCAAWDLFTQLPFSASPCSSSR